MNPRSCAGCLEREFEIPVLGDCRVAGRQLKLGTPRIGDVRVCGLAPHTENVLYHAEGPPSQYQCFVVMPQLLQVKWEVENEGKVQGLTEMVGLRGNIRVVDRKSLAYT